MYVVAVQQYLIQQASSGDIHHDAVCRKCATRARVRHIGGPTNLLHTQTLSPPHTPLLFTSLYYVLDHFHSNNGGTHATI